jgi:helix-turn-helix protein
MNKEKKLIEKNIELSAEFSRYLFEHPEVQDKIPMDSEIILLPDYDQELKEFNLRMGKDIEAGGEKVFYLSIDHFENQKNSIRVCFMTDQNYHPCINWFIASPHLRMNSSSRVLISFEL